MLPKGLLKEYSRTLATLTGLMDMLMVFTAGLLTYFIKFDTLTFTPDYIKAIFIGVILMPIVFNFSNIYSSIRGQGFVSHFMHLVKAVLLLALVLAGAAFFTKSGETFSRLWFGYWMCTSLLFLILFRCGLLLCLRFMRSRGLNERRVVIIGASELGVKLAKTVQQALWTGFRVLTFLDDDASHKPAFVHHIPVIKTPKELGDYLVKEKIDEIWLALPLRAEARVKEILHELRHHTINTRFVLDFFGLDLFNHAMTDIAGFPVLNISSTPMSGMNRLIKAIEDRVLAAVILILISPLLVLIAIGVRLSSPGSIFFKQQRLGWDGRIINIYKFRTMKAHEEEHGCVTQATANDQRVTPFGRFLRKSSLDELPQFINVMQGRMSIVGPRPHALAHNELYKDSIHTYMQRHRVKPGITGWAQVNGWRGETDTLTKMEKRVEYDLFYINNWSLWFDFKIIFLTIFRGFINPNAY